MFVCALLLLGGFLVLLVLLKIECDPALYFYKYFGKKPETLRGKVVWITGAGSGIGRQLAVSLAQVGARLVLHSLPGEDLDAVKGRCLRIARGCLKDEDVLVLYGDVADIEMHEKWVDQVLKHFSKVDILINNAGIGAFQSVLESPWSAIRRLFEVNLFGNVGLARALLPHFRQRKAGHIVVPSSVLAFLPIPNASAYGASKRAIQGFYDTLRAEEVGHGVKVTVLFPGYVKTNIFANSATAEGTGVDMGQLRMFEMRVERFADWMLLAVANEMISACIAKGWLLFVAAYHFPDLARRAEQLVLLNSTITSVVIRPEIQNTEENPCRLDEGYSCKRNTERMGEELLKIFDGEEDKPAIDRMATSSSKWMGKCNFPKRCNVIDYRISGDPASACQ
ncbi:unnamed protein product [Darwinula stevensoni]|uniref:Ketoreductase domain-containing protein n=1 Tax=Darwinula stevensoni TaxID=69355 RepID=A0A7R8X5Y9_9CRUS|nr:unnamed protein product [Darwinula stevensoni]CAG0885160.1 unnamed protein product [Darwinula stevensoni]